MRGRASSSSSTTTYLLSSSSSSSASASASQPKQALSTISELISASFSKTANHDGNKRLRQLAERQRVLMERSIGPRAHWLSRMRSCLRLLVIVLSGAVVCMLCHTIEIYRGNRYLDLRHGELPMTWPAHTNLAPTIILFAVAAANFLASVAILTLSLKRSFRRPFRSRDVYRIVAGSFGVITWITALVVFSLLDRASKASLGRYSCTNASLLTNGRYQYRAVCKEQGVAFYTAIGAALAETLTLITLGISAILSYKTEDAPPVIKVREKNNSISSGSQFHKPLRR